MKIELAESINTLVSSKYLSAKSSGSLVFSRTDLTIIRSRNGLPFQLRYCPALSKKPGANSFDSEASRFNTPKLDPFENPAESLLVARLPNERDPTHNLVLNKYPVIHRHSIIATSQFKEQTSFLESQDLDVTYSCLKAWEAESTKESPSRLFAFFNSGEHSGASQAHRHLQLLPVEDLLDSDSPRSEWQPLIDLITEPLPDNPDVLSNPSVSFRHYAMRIPEEADAGVLSRNYHRLYECASKAVQSWDQGLPPKHTAPDNNSGEAMISYNLAMTTHVMAICPRRKEAAKIPTTGLEAAVNGTILAGTLMVKELSDWEVIRQNEVNIDDILAEIGIPFSTNSEINDLSMHSPVSDKHGSLYEDFSR